MKMKSIENAVKKLGLEIVKREHGPKMWYGVVVGVKYTFYFYQYKDSDSPSSVSIGNTNATYDAMSDTDNHVYPDTIKEIIYYLTRQ